MTDALPILIPGMIFLAIDLFILFKLLVEKCETTAQKLFLAFAVAVCALQGLSVLSYARDFGLFSIPTPLMYLMYSFMIPIFSFVAYLWFLYFVSILKESLLNKWYINIGFVIPIVLLVILTIVSCWTHWLFYLDENGNYQSGKYVYLQAIFPYLYTLFALIIAVIELRHKSGKEVWNVFRFYLLYVIPSTVGAYIQLRIYRGGYTQISVSCALFLLYTELYVRAIEENKRLQSVAVLNKSLEKANEDLRKAYEEQESQLEEIVSLNSRLQDNQHVLERSYSLQEAQMGEISLLNGQLKEKQSILEEQLDIIAKTGYGIWKIALSNDGKNRMYIDSTLKNLFGIEDACITPEQVYNLYHSRLIDDTDNIEKDDYRSMSKGHLRSRNLLYNHPILGRRQLLAGGTSHVQPNGETIISGYCKDITERVEQESMSNHIIYALASTYMFVNYVTLEDGTFISSNINTYFDDEDWSISKEGDLRKTLDYTISKRVSPDYKEEVSVFVNPDTLKERLKDKDILICQYKNDAGIWTEWAWIVADRDGNGVVRHLIWALRKIEDEKQAELRKQRILEDNIAANKAKTVFLQNMSHEIRTPLNAMFGFAQLLGLPDGSWTDAEKDQYNNYIYNSYNMLDMLIGDIIDIADSESGNYRINISEVQINEVCRNALMSVEYRVPQGVNSYFTTDYEDDFTIQSDGRRIQQVLINYLTNACKYTQQGEIHLHCSKTEHPGKISFSVTDTGKGIPADKAKIIFNRFIKLNSFVQGSGLGLNICQMIADKLNGQVYLDQEYTGGARFVFVIDDNHQK